AEAEQPFARTVDRHLLGDDLGPIEQEMVGERLSYALLDVGHPLEIGDAVEVDPVPELARAHLGLALVEPDAGKGLAQLRFAQPDERTPRRRRGARGMARMVEVEGNAQGVGPPGRRSNIVCRATQKRGRQTSLASAPGVDGL